MTSGPLLISILGVQAPALSLLIGLASVVLIRVMLVSTEPRTHGGWWFYNIALTLLLTLIVFVFILDKQLGPGVSLIVGIGVGASGVVTIDLLKKKAETFVQGFMK